MFICWTPEVLLTNYQISKLLLTPLTIVFFVSLRLGYPMRYLIMKYYLIYSIYRKYRDSRRGGVLLAIKDNITSTQLPSPSNVEIITVLISMDEPFIISVVYISPNSNDTYHEQLHNHLTNLANELNPLILLGDFNDPDVDWATYSGSSPKANKLFEVVVSSSSSSK